MSGTRFFERKIKKKRTNQRCVSTRSTVFFLFVCFFIRSFFLGISSFNDRRPLLARRRVCPFLRGSGCRGQPPMATLFCIKRYRKAKGGGGGVRAKKKKRKRYRTIKKKEKKKISKLHRRGRCQWRRDAPPTPTPPALSLATINDGSFLFFFLFFSGGPRGRHFRLCVVRFQTNRTSRRPSFLFGFVSQKNSPQHFSDAPVSPRISVRRQLFHVGHVKKKENEKRTIRSCRVEMLAGLPAENERHHFKKKSMAV